MCGVCRGAKPQPHKQRGCHSQGSSGTCVRSLPWARPLERVSQMPHELPASGRKTFHPHCPTCAPGGSPWPPQALPPGLLELNGLRAAPGPEQPEELKQSCDFSPCVPGTGDQAAAMAPDGGPVGRAPTPGEWWTRCRSGGPGFRVLPTLLQGHTQKASWTVWCHLHTQLCEAVAKGRAQRLAGRGPS